MKLYTLPLAALIAFSANAQDVKAPPHSLTGTVNYTTVKLQWANPTADNVLKWHNDYSYNGISGVRNDPESSATIYAANRFAPEDLVGKVGEKVTHIAYNEYRNVADVTVMIYEDGKAVYSQPVQVTNWVKDAMRKVELTTPYVIPEGKEIMFVIKKVHGYNQDFAAICDKTVTPGKGNVYSYDGEKWYENGPGDFLITAYIENEGNVKPNGYNVYVDGTKVNDKPTINNNYTLKDQSAGNHTYAVSAVYGEEEIKSYELPLTAIDINTLIAPVVSLSGSVKDLNSILSWSEPLLHSNELTWSGKEMGLSIGGTASSNTKVWIRQDFDADELYFGSFNGSKITALNSYIAEDAITDVAVFIMKDGVIDYYEYMPENVVDAINAGEWNKFTLYRPYVIEDDAAYSIGIYYLQKPGAHPVGVDNRPTIDVKANSFSTSSPNTDFSKSNPSWRTLASGDILGNFMLSADVEPVGDIRPQPVIKGYEVYRNGEKIGQTAETTFNDTVEDLGKYTYAVKTLAEDGKVSLAKSINLNYTLPSGYVTPTILASSFDQKNKEVSISWSPDAYEMRYFNTPTYIFGFDDDMDGLMWGAQFAAEDMADYAGYKMNSITFGIGDEVIGDFDIVVMADKEELYSIQIDEGTIDAGYVYTIKLDDQNVYIPEGKSIYLAYRADVVPAESTPILLDAGPAKTGGAMVSLSYGRTWNKLSTLSPSLAAYNVVIGAIISPDSNTGSTAETAIGSQPYTILPANRVILSASELRKLDAEDKVEAIGMKKAPHKAAPKAASFKIYRNGEVIAETTDTEFKEVLKNYGYFTYNVRSIFTNGWESANSKSVNVVNLIPQKTQAPYNLRGEDEDGTLKLSWESVDAEAAVMKYHNDEETNMAFGMTGTGTREGYHAIRFKAQELTPGTKVSHIKFMLNEIENEKEQRLASAAVFVMVDESIMFEQNVSVSSLETGVWNVVRLNRPFEVPAGHDVAVGYHITYPNGLKPCLTDNGPAVSNYGDLISSSASEGYWYSLNEKYGLNYNYRMEAVFQTPDQEIKKVKGNAEGMTYSVQCDGVDIVTGLTEMKYDVVNAENGYYTVTACVGDNESAESNGVQYGENQSSGVESVENAVVNAYYDAATKTVVLAEADNANVFTIGGALIERHISTDRVELSTLAPGAYIIATDGGVVVKVMR